MLDKYQERFRYISVDEYQDTNHVQYEIANLLAAKYQNLMVVGDDDQSIYSWRGADITNILDFEKDFKNCKTVKLEQNYRSTGHILSAANAVVRHNSQRKDKRLFTAEGDGEKIQAFQASDERDEGRWIAGEIEKLHAKGTSYDDIAVFYRTNAQSRILEDMFLRAGVPYKIVGGTRFFDRAVASAPPRSKKSSSWRATTVARSSRLARLRVPKPACLAPRSAMACQALCRWCARAAAWTASSRTSSR